MSLPLKVSDLVIFFWEAKVHAVALSKRFGL